MAKSSPVEIKFKVEPTSMYDLTNRFIFHKANEVKAEQHQTVRNLCYQLSVQLNELLPESREKSLTITKLEEVMFWANAAIARNNTESGHE